MGLIRDILSKYSIAMEVDDITAEVDSETNATLNDTPKEANDTGGNVAEDLTETDIIHGGTETESIPPTDDEDSYSEDGEDMGDESAGENSPDDDIPSDTQKPEETPFDKTRIKNNMVLFLNILDNNIIILRECMNNVVETDSVNLFNNVLDNFQSCKSTLMDLLLYQNLDDVSYTDLMKTYVAVNRIHEIGIRMLKLHMPAKSSSKLKTGKIEKT